MLVLLVSVGLTCWAITQPNTTEYAGWYARQWQREPLLMVLNILPVLLVAAALYLATGRSLMSGLITAGVFLLMAVINSIKAGERNEPFLPTDIGLVREALAVVGQYGRGNIILLWSLVLGTLLLSVLAVRLFAPRLHPAVRVAGPVAATAALIVLVFTVYADTDYYDSFYSVPGNRVSDYGSKGFVYSFTHNITATRVREPDTYSADDFAELEAALIPAEVDLSEAARPNVVMIMAEAFNEVTELEAIDFTGHRDPLKNFKAIAEESVVYGHLIADVFGGGTVFTEFAALTGISPTLLSDAVSPYELMPGETDSLAWRFSELGYDTLAIHPGEGWFYDRINAYEKLGFDEYRYLETHFQDSVERGGYVSEESTMDALIEAMDEQLEEDNPLFLFCVTIQNHGGYGDKYVSQRKFFFDTDLDIPDEDLLALDNYIIGLLDVDAQLLRLVNYLEDSDEPYVLVYFGDHAPSLTGNLYGHLGWGAVYGERIDALEAYTVPYIIWQNSAAREEMDLEARAEEMGLTDDTAFSPFYLGPVLMELLEFDSISPFLTYVGGLRETYPVLSSSLNRAAGEDYTTDVPESVEDIYTLYSRWCYYKVFDDVQNRAEDYAPVQTE